jgi:hypothetical protein
MQQRNAFLAEGVAGDHQQYCCSKPAVLLLQVCNAAEKLAATKCGKYYKDVFEQTQLLRVSICAQAGSIFASQVCAHVLVFVLLLPYCY